MARVLRLTITMVGINTNISALTASAKLSGNAVEQATAMQRLSTGLHVNSAKDDAAALAVSTGLVSQIKGMAQAIKNVNDGISLSQTAESALGSVVGLLQRMRELALQSMNGTLTDSNRQSLQLEYDASLNQINDILNVTNFNGIKLFDGSASSLKIQNGANFENKDNINIPKMNTDALLSKKILDVSGLITGAVTNFSTSNAGYSDYIAFNNTNQNLIGTIKNIPVGNSARTIELFAQIPSNVTNGVLFQYGIPSLSGAKINDNDTFSLQISNGNLYFWGHNNDLSSTGFPINDDKYHKLSVTFDGTTISLYVDGVLANQSNSSNVINPNTEPSFSALDTKNNLFSVGNYNIGGQSLQANIKTISIYNKSLTQAQISAEPSQLNGDESNLVAYYDFQFQKTVKGLPVYTDIKNTVNGSDPLTYNGWDIQPLPTAENIASASQGGSVLYSAQNINGISTVDKANISLPLIDNALSSITNLRTYLGAIQNSFQAVVENLTSGGTNAQQANGRLIDTDYAETTTQLSRSQIISQAATAMLAQANQSSQLVLQLLKP